MTEEEKSAIIGYYRMGITFWEISYMMGISESYVKSIVDEYLKSKPCSKISK